ncbi:MAG: MBL fold metallo-hydrolase [Gemmatimonadota bacterium]|nr:MBL fold metallo-hydrolase [Gemmatimonadota bacterium]
MRFLKFGLIVSAGLALVGKELLAQPAVDVAFLDVGQGDAVLVRSPESRYVLIDSGPDDGLARRLLQLGVTGLELVIATHPHADHIGGMAEVVSEIPIARYVDNGVPHTTQTYRHLLRTLSNTNLIYAEADGQTFSVGSVTVRLLPTNPNATTHNDRSVGLIVEFGEFRAILTGDAEIDALNYWIERGVPTARLLKASHHGSRDAVSPGWLSTVRPEAVVISAGRENRYGHPHPWAMRYYEAGDRQVYRTDLVGDVQVKGYADGSFFVQTGQTTFDAR